MEEQEIRFGFGANWQSFATTTLNEDRLAEAVRSLQSYLDTDNLKGRRFLDIGCGSGLFSLAACMLGADEVVSFDYDPSSVATSMGLRDKHGIPESKWRISRGSVIDDAFVASLGSADIVYSWGVLHHTGSMWKAIDNAASAVRPGGLFAIAIYNRVSRFPDHSAMWWKIKRFYCTSPAVMKRLIEFLYGCNHFLTRLVTLRNPFKPFFESHGAGRRGMEFWHDAKDWLGGFPYEYATAGEIFQYVADKFGYPLVRLNTVEGNACNEFVFRRP